MFDHDVKSGRQSMDVRRCLFELAETKQVKMLEFGSGKSSVGTTAQGDAS